jgi:hypothetical protein
VSELNDETIEDKKQSRRKAGGLRGRQNNGRILCVPLEETDRAASIEKYLYHPSSYLFRQVLSKRHPARHSVYHQLVWIDESDKYID